MANYVCRNVTKLPEYHFADIRVPAAMTDGLVAGSVVVADKLDSALYENLNVYAPTKVADITKEDVAIVLNGTFETMNDGRRPDGNPNYTEYVFKPGDIATTVRLMKNQRFELSVDACDSTVAAAATAGTLVPGDNLVPKNGETKLTYSKAGTAITAKNSLTVEALKFFRLGGMYGMEMAQTMVVRAN